MKGVFGWVSRRARLLGRPFPLIPDERAALIAIIAIAVVKVGVAAVFKLG